MAIAFSKTREKYPLSPKKIIKKTILSLIGWLFIFGIFYAVLAVIVFGGTDLSFIPVLPITIGVIFIQILIAIITYLYQLWYFNVYFYDLTEDFIVIRKGPITPHEITIPYERVQDVYVDQDIFDRIFGLYDVHLSSATVTSGMEAHIDGVEKPAADGLRTHLLQTVSQKIGKNKPL